jgi:hypothetical protein
MSIKCFNIENGHNGIGNIPFYIILGTSNCGRSRVSAMSGPESALYASPISNAYMLNSYRYTYNGVNAFEQLDAGSNTMLHNYAYSDEFGMETSLAYQLEAYQSKPRYYCKIGVGSSIVYTDWLSGQADYVILQNTVGRALIDASNNNIDLKLHAIIAMMGENDATNNTWASDYAINQASFFSTFHTWWTVTKGMNSNYKRVVGRIEGAGDPSQVYYTTVKSAQDAYCADSSNHAIKIDTDSYPRQDSVHYSPTGQIQFGIDIFNQVKDL